MPRTAKPTSAFAALALEIKPLDDGAMLLIPAGTFRAYDGRPAGVAGWNLTAALAARVISDRQARGTAIVIDWEHATLHRAKKGDEAPAAGWIDPADLAWRDGVGIVALRRSWTPRAEAQMTNDEYRYGSPVFRFNEQTGDVLGLHSFALTNDPGLDGIAVALAALVELPPPTPETPMDEDLLEQLRWLLNLPTLATPEEVVAELQKAVAQLKASQAATATAAASFDLVGTVQRAGAAQAEIASLSAQVAAPDPARFVPVATHRAVSEQLAALQADVRGKAIDGLVTAALADGRLNPAQEVWARDLGASDIAKLQAFVDSATPLAALSGMQTGGKAPVGDPASQQLTTDALAVCSLMGLTPDQFAKGAKP
jgi:phage I-like protein